MFNFVQLSLASTLFFSSPASAQDPSRIASTSILTGWQQDDGSHVAALRFEMESGWHTYWRVPGQVGIPWEFDWAASKNLKSVTFEWPRPDILETFGYVSFVFEDELVLPVRLVPIDARKPVEISVVVDYGLCSEICIPATADLDGSLDVSENSHDRNLIEQALSHRAQSADEAGIIGATCNIVPTDKGYSLATNIEFSATQNDGQYVVMEVPDPLVWIDFAVTETDGHRVSGQARIDGLTGDGVVLDRSSVRVTVLDADRAVEVRGCSAPG